METTKLENIEEILNNKEFIILGHGTGRRGNDLDIVESIFDKGLRASHTSIFYTTNLIQFDDIDELKQKLSNWGHFDSKNIILIRLPLKYFVMIGDSSDLYCDRTAAFVNKTIDSQEKEVFYLDPKFIIGCYNTENKIVYKNKKFKEKFDKDDLTQMNEKMESKINEIKERHELMSKI